MTGYIISYTLIGSMILIEKIKNSDLKEELSPYIGTIKEMFNVSSFITKSALIMLFIFAMITLIFWSPIAEIKKLIIKYLPRGKN